MIVNPYLLTTIIIISFLLVLLLSGSASEPLSVQGTAFWMAFVTFAICCIQLERNDRIIRNE